MLVRVCVVSASSKCLKIIMQQYSMQTEVILKYRADNRCYRSSASRARTPEHMHTNTHSSDHRNARHAAEASVMRALGPTAAAGVLCTGSVRSPAALAPSRRPERTPLRAAARAVAIAAAAAFGPRVVAAAADLLAKDARMTAGEVSMPVGRGGGLKQPPGRRSVACCSAASSHRACDRAARGAFGRGLPVPMRSKHASLAIGMMSDTCQRLKDGSQCTGAVSRESEGRRGER